MKSRIKKYWSFSIGHLALTKGFTLMELLVVIAIMAILVSLGTVSYSNAQKKSRDSKRKADIKSIQNAMEQYFADNGAYPGTCSTISLDTTYFPGGFPKDPKTGVSYDAAPPNGINSCSATAYYFGSSLEATANGGNATDESCTNGSGAYFCVKNLQ